MQETLLDSLKNFAIVWYSKNDKKQCLNYIDLCREVGNRTYYLINQLKIKKGDVVGVVAPRGPQYLITMLSLWKIGAVYFPLSDAWKESGALSLRLKKSGAICLLTVDETYQQYQTELDQERTFCIDKLTVDTEGIEDINILTNFDAAPDLPAYIFSSSGTTGEPKLIQVPHAGIWDRIDDHIEYMGIKCGDGVLGFIDFGFDASIVEMLIALRSNSTLFIAPQEVRDQSYQKLPEFIKRHAPDICVGILLPSVLKGLKPEHCPGLTKIVTMGEACLLDQLRNDKWFEHAKIYNGYGPTETTFGASLTILSQEDKIASIHRPMKGISLYLRESFSLLFLCGTEKGTDKKANIFYLSFSKDEEKWHYSIQYEIDTDYFVPTQGYLDTEWNESIKNIQAEDKVTTKEEARLLRHLIEKTVKNPRIIAKFTQNAQPKKMVKTQSESVYGEIVIAGSGIGTYLNLDEKVKEKFRTAEQARLEGYDEPCLFISGDIAEFNGQQLIYKNRNDNQIKRYGQLVTIDDIENALRGCDLVDDVVVLFEKDTVIAFIQPKNLILFDDNPLEKSAGKKFEEYKKTHIDKKLKPTISLWVKTIPKQAQRNKASRKMSDYINLETKLKRISGYNALRIDKSLEILSNIWRNLLEAGTSQLNLENPVYDPMTRFEELGGDSLLTSLMIQEVWREHNKNNPAKKSMPAPNDFSNCIIQNPTLAGIQQFLACYGHQVVKEISVENNGLPIFIFENVNKTQITMRCPIYQYDLPEIKNSKILLNILKSQTREKQASGIYHFICTSVQLELAHSLAKSFAQTGAFVYLTIAGDITHLQKIFIETESKSILIDLQINYCTFDNLNLKILHCYEKRLEKTVIAHLELLQKYFFNTEINLSVNLGVFNINLNSSETTWLIGEAKSGKTTGLKNALFSKKGNDFLLPLNITGIQKFNVFEAALEKVFPRWQWAALRQCIQSQKKSLVIIIDGYETSARLDCPNLWEQAAEIGFSPKKWIITCRKSYWYIYQSVLRGYDINHDWKIIPVISPDLKKITINGLTDKIQHYDFLLKQFKKEYQHFKPSVPESQYIQNAFDTLALLYQRYIKAQKINLELEPSHWETQKSLPSIHALPALGAVFSLTEFHRISPELIVYYPHTKTEYESILKKTLKVQELILIKNPEDKIWHWCYVRSGTNLIEKQALDPWMVFHLKKALAEFILCHEEKAIQEKTEEISEFIQDWHPLMFAHLPDHWAIEANNYADQYQKSCNEAKSQILSPADVNEYQQQFSHDFWESLSVRSENNPRYHVLPLQHAPDSIPIFIFHPLTGETPVHYRSLAEALGPHQSFYALQMGDNDNDTNISDKADLYYHYIKNIQPKGPYVLMGWSFGAVMAYYIAVLLEKDGQEVDWVINFDSPAPGFILSHNIADRALDMISVLTSTVYKVPKEIFNLNTLKSSVDKKIENKYFDDRQKAVLYFHEAIGQVNQTDKEGKYQNFCKAMHKASFNLQVYHDFGKWCLNQNPKLKAKYWIFEATEEKSTYLNDADFTQWKNYCEQTIKLEKIEETHFSLFSTTLFNQLKPRLKKYQRQTQVPLLERIASYRRKRMEDFEKSNQDKNNLSSIYIPSMTDSEKEGESPFPIETAIEKFLTNQEFPQGAKCFLLQGDPGSGKSHYSKQLEKILWENKKYLPIFVALKPVSTSFFRDALINNFLTETEFDRFESRLQNSPEDKRQEIIIENFGAPLLIILDGYDESLSKDNLYLKENLSFWNAKVFISCRSYAVKSQTMYAQFGDENKRIQTVYLKPFNQDDIKSYLNIYYANTGIKLCLDNCEEMLDKSLIQNPLLLSIAIEFWSDLPNFKNKAALYKAFFDKLYEADEKRIEAEQGIRYGVRLIHAFEGYNQLLAQDYWHQSIAREKKGRKNELFDPISNNKDSQQALLSNRLGIDSEGRLSHITFWEYQLAGAIINAILRQDYSDLDSAYPLILGEASICDNLSLLKMISDLAEMLFFEQFDRLRHHLLLTVYTSRYFHKNPEKDRARVQSASNAISILNFMRTPFSGLDLREIRVKGAYLSNGLFDTACLRYADLTDTKLHNVIFRYTDLRGANLSGVDFGQMPALKCDETVRRIAYSHNGKLLAVASGNNVEIWDTNKNERLFILEKHCRQVNDVAFSPDNRYLASAGEDHLIYLWSTETHQLLAKFSEHRRSVLAIAFSPDGKLLASGSQDKTICVWSLNFYKLLTKLKQHKRSVLTLAFSPDGSLLASGSVDKSVCLWSSENHKLLYEFKEHMDSILCVAFSPDGMMIGSGSEDKTLRLWSTKSYQKLAELKGHSPFSSILFSLDSKILFASVGNHIQIWSTENYQLLDIKGNNSPVKSIALSPDGKTLAFGNLDKPVKFWSVTEAHQLLDVNGHNSSIRAVVFTSSANTLATGSYDGTVRLWDCKKQKLKSKLTNIETQINSICFTSDNKNLVWGGQNRTGFFSLTKRTKNKNETLLSQGSLSVVFSPNGKILALGSKDNKIYLFSSEDHKLMNILEGHAGFINSLAFSPDGKILASGSDDKTICIWSSESYLLLKKLERHADSVLSVAFSPDGEILASGGKDKKICLWSGKKYCLLNELHGHTFWINALAFDFEGKILVSGSYHGKRLWDIKTGRLLSFLKPNGVNSIAYNPHNVLAFAESSSAMLWSAVPYTDFFHQQIIAIYANSQTFNVEKLLCEGAQISQANKKLLTQDINPSEAVKYAIWPEVVSNDAIFPIASYSQELFSHVTVTYAPQILHRLILQNLNQENWATLACLNGASNTYFGKFKRLIETLVAQAMPIPHHYSQKWMFDYSGNDLWIELNDAFNIRHSLVWPEWFLKNLKPLRTQNQIFKKKSSALTLEELEKERITLVFEESSLRRLVYLLSTTYLLSAALKSAIKIGLHHCINDDITSLSRVYDLCSDYKPEYLNHLIFFLSQHQIFEYDINNEEVCLGRVGKGLYIFSNYDEKKIEELSERCKIYYQDLSLSVTGNSLELLSALYLMKDFSKKLHTVAKLNLFNSTSFTEKKGEMSPLDLACFESLHRYHFLTQNAQKEYELTQLGEYLQSDHPETLQPTLSMLDAPWWKAVDEFDKAFQVGRFSAFEQTNKKPFFRYLAENARAQSDFNEGLACLTKYQDKIIVQKLKFSDYDFCHYRTIIDIAGGAGGLLKSIQANYPYCHKLTLYDQPSVIADIKSKDEAEIKNWKLISGNFFESKHNIPKNQKLYIIKGVLHDFDDMACLQILSKIRESMSEKSRLYVIERTLRNIRKPHINDYGDMMMMMLLNGHGRYTHEWLRLFLQAGFQWVNESDPIEAEDHTIMVCQPKQPEISRSLPFFKVPISERENYYRQRKNKLMSKDVEIPHHFAKDICLIRKMIYAQQFGLDNKDYYQDYINLLCKSLNPDEANFMMLSATDINHLKNFNLNINQSDQDYYFLPIGIEKSWVGLFVDRRRNIVFYLNPNRCPMPEEIKTFLNQRTGIKDDFTLIQLFADDANIKIMLNQTGLYLVALLANMVQKINRNDSPSGDMESMQNWLIHSAAFICYQNSSNVIESLSQQQLRWAIDYLSEKMDQDAVMPKLVYRKMSYDFGCFNVKSVAKTAFAFFDEKTVSIMGCVNRGFHEVQLEAQLEKSLSS